MVLKNLCSGTQCIGFQFLLISFHAVVVFGLGIRRCIFKKSVLGYCVELDSYLVVFLNLNFSRHYLNVTI